MFNVRREPVKCATCKFVREGRQCSHLKVAAKSAAFLSGEADRVACWTERSKTEWNAPCGMRGRLWEPSGSFGNDPDHDRASPMF
jgi:hypothetical protein